MADKLCIEQQSKDQGSRRWFREQWANSLAAERCLYPKGKPITQWEMFEREKALHIDAILAEHGLSKGWVLEFGCGTGGMSVYLANQGFQAIATDVSSDAVRLANLNFQKNGQRDDPGGFCTTAADVYRLPFQSNVFDVAMSHGVLEHFDQRSLPLVVQEVIRTLKPGGLFLADIAHGRFSARKVARWFSFPLLFGYHLLTANTDKLRATFSDYFESYYENALTQEEWRDILEHCGLINVELKVHRPFPPFPLTPMLNRKYVDLMEKLLPLWRWFDNSQSWLARHLGWLYLAYGTKP